MERWEAAARIWEIIGRLRGEGGCPWDRRQTPETVQTYLIEEAHEAAAAVRSGPALDVAEELGDLLFMVFFMIHLYEEKGAFRLEDVCRAVSEKMIRRHPHVFGDWTVDSPEEVKDNWEKIKAAEQADSGKAPGAVPASLPALMRAYRTLSRLPKTAESKRDDAVARGKQALSECRAMFERLADGGNPSSSSFGELLYALVKLARIHGHQAEISLHRYLDTLPNSLHNARNDTPDRDSADTEAPRG